MFRAGFSLLCFLGLHCPSSVLVVSPLGFTSSSRQYSVTEFFRPSDPNKDGQLLPGVFVFYELSPIRVEYEDKRRSFPHFLVQLSAIVGGVWAMAGMVDTGIFHGARVLREKRGLGKHI